jgi:hypothetical protein
MLKVEDYTYCCITRGESCSIGSTERKREDTSSSGLSERRKIGRRSDLIIRSAGNGRNVEYGAAEVGRVLMANMTESGYMREA